MHTKFCCNNMACKDHGATKTMDHEHKLEQMGSDVKCSTCGFSNPAPSCDGCRVTMEMVEEAEENA